jgi:glycine/D-amino acid oxidase-like deaminating enzyme
MHYTHEALVKMALRARGVFEHFDEIVGGDAGFRRTGFIALVGSRDIDALRKNVAMQNSVGVNACVLLPSDLRKLEPRFETIGEDGAAAWEPDSGHADPHCTANAYADAARRLGVEIRLDATVNRIRVDNGAIESVETNLGRIETRTLVVAAGYHTCALVAPLGFDVPLTPVRHTIATVQRTPRFGAFHPVISDRVLGCYYRPEGADLTLVGTTAPFDGLADRKVDTDRAPREEDLHSQAARFSRRFPSQGDAKLRGGYTGVYDCSPDLQPLLGPVPGIGGLHIAVGFSGHGFKLSPVIGELIAEKIVKGRTALVDIDFFNPGRFAQNRLIKSAHSYSVATLG